MAKIKTLQAVTIQETVFATFTTAVNTALALKNVRDIYSTKYLSHYDGTNYLYVCVIEYYDYNA